MNSEANQEKQVFNLQQAADYAGVSVPTMAVWARQKGFPAFKAGRRWLIPRTSFTAWLESMAQQRAQL